MSLLIVMMSNKENERYCESCGHKYLTQSEKEQRSQKISNFDVLPLLNEINEEIKLRHAENKLINIRPSEYQDKFGIVFKDKAFGLRANDLSDNEVNLKVGHHGDIFAGFLALEDVTFNAFYGGVYFHEFHMKAGEFNYALYNNSMLAIIGLQYSKVTISPKSVKDKVKLLFANIADYEPRTKLAHSTTYYNIGDGKHIIQQNGSFLTHDIPLCHSELFKTSTIFPSFTAGVPKTI